MLYRQYLEYKSKGIFETVLYDLYVQGTKLNWKVPGTAGPVATGPAASTTAAVTAAMTILS